MDNTFEKIQSTERALNVLTKFERYAFLGFFIFLFICLFKFLFPLVYISKNFQILALCVFFDFLHQTGHSGSWH